MKATTATMVKTRESLYTRSSSDGDPSEHKAAKVPGSLIPEGISIGKTLRDVCRDHLGATTTTGTTATTGTTTT